MNNNYNYNYGAPQAPQAPVAPQAPQAPKKFDLSGDNKKFIFIGAGALVAVIIIIAIIAGVAGNGFKKPVKAYAEGIQENDGKIVVEAYYEDYVDGWEDSLEERIEIIADYLEDECGKGYKVKVEFKDKEKYNKDDIEDFVEDLEDDYGIEYDADDFSKFYEVCTSNWSDCLIELNSNHAIICNLDICVVGCFCVECRWSVCVSSIRTVISTACQ